MSDNLSYVPISISVSPFFSAPARTMAIKDFFFNDLKF